jgi:hypothetical protein
MSDDIKIYRKLVPVEVCQRVEEKLKDRTNWYCHSFTPHRLNVEIDEFSELEKIMVEHFSDYEYIKNKRCYFSVYEKGEYCVDHSDPTGHTLVILIKKPEHGGMLSVGSTAINLDIGDGVLFDGSIQHRVTTVFEGTRISFAAWFK